jgi:hypothetical protein
MGSGDPISDDARASSGAIVWIDGKARLLIDAGGGTYSRYGPPGAGYSARMAGLHRGQNHGIHAATSGPDLTTLRKQAREFFDALVSTFSGNVLSGRLRVQ